MTMSEEKINFLDIKIYKNQENGLSTKIYFKETDNRTLLHKTSHHPQHTFRGIITSQLKRYKDLCSTREDFLKNSWEVIKILKNQGYSFQRMKEILKKKLTRRKDTRNILPIILRFCKFSEEIAETFIRTITNNIIYNDVKFTKAFKVGKNLQKLLF